MTLPASANKSTTGRINSMGPQRRPPLAFRALRALELVSSELAARVGAHVMFRTQRRSAEACERVLEASARNWTLQSPRGAIAVSRWGAGPLVLLVHGWNGRRGQLGAFVPPLVGAGYQVVAFDAPGHGASTGSHSSIVEFADALELVVDELRPFFQPIHAVIAHSLGGPAVMLSMTRWRGRPDLAEGALCDGPFDRTRLVFIAPPIDMRDVTREFGNMIGLGNATRARLDAFAEKRLGRPLGDMYAPDVARSMRSPLLVLHDEHDRAVPVSAGRLLADAWPGAALEVTQGLGHTRILRHEPTVQKAVHFVTTTTRPTVPRA